MSWYNGGGWNLKWGKVKDEMERIRKEMRDGGVVWLYCGMGQNYMQDAAGMSGRTDSRWQGNLPTLGRW